MDTKGNKRWQVLVWRRRGGGGWGEGGVQILIHLQVWVWRHSQTCSKRTSIVEPICLWKAHKEFRILSFFFWFSAILCSCDSPVVNGKRNSSTRRKPMPYPKSLATFSLAPAGIQTQAFLKWREYLKCNLNPPNAENTFVQSTRMQDSWKNIETLSSWYSFESSRRVLSDEYPFARVSVIFPGFLYLFVLAKVA